MILYLGDWDPSGLGMSVQDLPRRLAAYVDSPRALPRKEGRDWSSAGISEFLGTEGIEFRRTALTVEDTRALGQGLSFPAADKREDARYAWFVREYGDRCWELDVMNPNDLRARVTAEILAEIDPVAWNRYVRAEEAERASIAATLGIWNSISGLAPEYSDDQDGNGRDEEEGK